MDFKLILLLVLGLSFGACAGFKDSVDGAVDAAENIWEGKQKLTVTFQTHRPYCGGAAPSKEQANGFTNPIANEVFYIYKGERPKSVTKMVKVTSDAEGKFSIDLEDGVYSIIREDKTLPLDKFIKKKKIEGVHYTYSTDDCFETWRTTPDFTIDLTHPTEEVVTIKERCFTGDNPCMKYTGPYPP